MKRKQPKSPRLTPWFDASVRPVHIGVYETDNGAPVGNGYAYWEDGRWGATQWSALWGVRRARVIAMLWGNMPQHPNAPVVRWRGLAKPPRG